VPCAYAAASISSWSIIPLDAAACVPGTRCVCSHQVTALFCMTWHRDHHLEIDTTLEIWLCVSVHIYSKNQCAKCCPDLLFETTNVICTSLCYNYYIILSSLCIQHSVYVCTEGVAFRGLPDVKLYPAVSAVYGNTEVSMVYLGHPLDGWNRPICVLGKCMWIQYSSSWLLHCCWLLWQRCHCG